jgi:hypothetical protein
MWWCVSIILALQTWLVAGLRGIRLPLHLALLFGILAQPIPTETAHGTKDGDGDSERLLFVNPLHADEPKCKPSDAKAIAAYEKLGGRYGSFGPLLGQGQVMFSLGEDTEGRCLPGFQFKVILDNKLPKLPVGRGSLRML